ncbi:YbhB/YbcL family Raf kinase inhibitor-like protein [Phenylobacterium sp.]|jgi:hypothetical protein|uniref:YbhB/YbcL family Raf kinase inhibitor-like protein n=1 Tax=Phenylobacterium sp. TaxID=1871053 RepID=UPI002F400E78
MRLPFIVFSVALATASPTLAAMTLTSTDLKPGATMPPAHIYPRCGGQNLSPQLAWSAPPKQARSLVLTMIDMDVTPNLWSHWIVTGLPARAGSLGEGLKGLPAGAQAVKSNFGEAAYDGPCPPPGSGVHHYRFTVWAIPATDFAADPDQKADELVARLSAIALDRAVLTVTAKAK